mgnify:CR=1 FL=1
MIRFIIAISFVFSLQTKLFSQSNCERFKKNNAVIENMRDSYFADIKDFIILFPNKTGVKYTCPESDYKTARESVSKNKLEEKKGIIYQKFTYSATSEYLWIEYNDGNYEECTFINFNKALKRKEGKEIQNYYLIK